MKEVFDLIFSLDDRVHVYFCQTSTNTSIANYDMTQSSTFEVKKPEAGKTASSQSLDLSWKGIYRWGGVSALLIGVLYFIAMVLALGMGTQPSGGEAVLTWLSGQTTLAYSVYGVAILTDILLVPVLLALYLALKGVNKNAMLAATGLAVAGVVLDLGVTCISWVALITLSQNYAAATSDALRASYVATANYALAATAVSAPIYSMVVPSIGLLIISLVMLKGIFSKGTAYVGISASIVGFVYGISLFVPALSAISLVIATILIAVFCLVVGSKLYKLGKR